MASVDAIATALARRARIDEWTVTQVREQTATRSLGAARSQLQSESVRSRVHVYRDTRRGRGSAWFDVHGGDDVEALISGAAARAGDNLGPPWRLPPAAAPARVSVSDDRTFADPAGEAARIAEAIGAATAGAGSWKPTGFEVDVSARVIDVRTSGDFAARYRATRVGYRATIGRANHGAVEPIRGLARRADDLAIDAAVARAVARLTERGTAARPGAGRYDVTLSDAALLGPGPSDDSDSDRDFGWWLPVVAQSSATLARQGLSRYRVGQSIYGDRELTGDPLWLRSDGTRKLAPYSAPFGDRGEPVRAFDLVRDGVAVGHPLDATEAGLRRTIPNGGARNLVVGPGSTPAAALSQPTGRPLLSVVDLAWLEIDPRTGALVADIALGTIGVGGARQVISGGSLRGNLFDLLARARYSRETEVRSWLTGPRVIRFDDVELV